MKFFQKSKAEGRYMLECYDKATGKLKWSTGFFIKNLETSVGKAALAGLAGNTGGIAAFGWLAVGTSNTAPTAADTTLGAEIVDSGLARVAATVSRVTTAVTNDTLQLTTTWNVSASKTVQEIGIFNASSAGIMLGHALTGAKAVSNLDQLVGTYQVQFS